MKVGFYSYKGGVGRTKVMVGTAALMAARGYRVGLIDFDLDASGLATMFGDQNESLGQKELLHILHKIHVQLKTSKKLAIDSLIPKNDLVKDRLGEDPDEAGGSVKYIPTISNPKLSDTIKFSPKFKASVDELFDHLLAVAGIDYLFIDMKPGYSPSASIVLPLCNRAVVVTRLDDQNIFGLQKSLPPLVSKLKLNPILVANMLPSSQAKAIKKEVDNRVERLQEATSHRVNVRIEYDVESVFDNDFRVLKDDASGMHIGLSTVVGKLTEAG